MSLQQLEDGFGPRVDRGSCHTTTHHLLGDEVRPYTSTWCLLVSFLVNWEWQQNRAAIVTSVARTDYQITALQSAIFPIHHFLGTWQRKTGGSPHSTIFQGVTP